MPRRRVRIGRSSAPRARPVTPTRASSSTGSRSAGTSTRSSGRVRRSTSRRSSGTPRCGSRRSAWRREPRPRPTSTPSRRPPGRPSTRARSGCRPGSRRCRSSGPTRTSSSRSPPPRHRGMALFAIHMRNYAGEFTAALDEAIRVARRAGVRIQISHMSSSGKANWSYPHLGRATLEAAAADGVDIAFDIYPFLAGSANLSQLLPDWVQAGGSAELVRRLTDPAERRRAAAEWTERRFLDWDEVEICLVDPGLEAYLGLTLARRRGADGRRAGRGRDRAHPPDREPGVHDRLRPVRPERHRGTPASARDHRLGRVRHGPGRPDRGGPAASSLVRLLPAAAGRLRPRSRGHPAGARDRDLDRRDRPTASACATGAGSWRARTPMSWRSTPGRSRTSPRIASRRSSHAASTTSS